MKLVFASLVFVTLILPPAQGLTSRSVNAEQKHQAVTELAKALRERYVLADVAEKTATFIEEKLARGGYEAWVDARPLCQYQ